VLDADGLAHVVGQLDAVRASGRVLLTPHPGEAARLLGTTIEAVESDRRGAVRRLLEATGKSVLLKGERTLIADPEATMPIAINTTGNAALAAGGSGDVLSGVLGAFCCHLAPREAAIAGAWLHGRAAELATGASGRRGLLAREIADHVALAIAEL
jgi:NAD(P)H-hydrate epimerase